MPACLTDGIYTLRYGPDVGPGGMYATQGEFDAPIPVIAMRPGTHQTWRIERTNQGDEDCKYRILNPQPHPPGVQQTGFYNESIEGNAPVILGQPKEFYIRATQKDKEYTISPTDKIPIGINVYVGDLSETAVTKAIPVIENPPPSPIWTIEPSSDKVEG